MDKLSTFSSFKKLKQLRSLSKTYQFRRDFIYSKIPDFFLE